MLNHHLIAETFPNAVPENVILAGKTRITVLTDALFRIEQDEEEIFCDEATQAVWYRNLPVVSYRVNREDGRENSSVVVNTGRVALRWEGSLEKSAVELADGARAVLDNRENLLGTYRTLDRCDGGTYIPSVKKGGEVHAISLEPGVASRNGVAILDDSDSLILAQDGQLRVRDRKEKDVYVFAYGRDYRGAVKALYRICGRTPLIPRFALGNWWSRYHAYTEKEYLHTVDRLAARGIPFTVATVDMDWHWSTTLDERKQITRQGKNDEWHGGARGWTGYSWNTDLFPDYRRFLRKLHERGLRVTMNLHPADGVRYFEDMYPEMAEAMGVDASSERQIPFDMTDARFVNAYFEVLHRPYEGDGVDFWWIDWQQGTESRLEGLDPLWALNHYHFLDHGRDHKPILLSRYCGVGAHRYPLGFSGDTFVTWETLDYLPYFTATASNVGYTWWSHDIGGHMCGYKNDELYVRFIQFGVFSPILRLHSSDHPAFSKEPMDYGNGSGLIAEEFLRLRHRMIPFLYSASVETNAQGLALIEPMYYQYPDAPESYECRNQYLFGRQLLVAPVTRPGDREEISEGMARVRVWLPEGRWTDIFTEDEYEGGQLLTMVRWMDSIPVLAKEGGFLVLDGRSATNDCGCPERLDVLVFNGNGEYTLYEDGEGGEDVSKIQFRSQEEKGVQRLTFRWRGGMSADAPAEREIRLEFRNILTGDVKILADGERYPGETDDNGRLTVEMRGIRPEITYQVTVTHEEDPFAKYKEQLCATMTRLQMDNDRKKELYLALAEADPKKRLRALEESGLQETVALRIREILGV